MFKYIKSGIRAGFAGKKINFAFLTVLLFPFYFAYGLYTRKLFYCHNDFAGMYYPFRQWFLNRLLNFEFPLWNPYWGCGHEAVIWATVPLDPYSILEPFLVGRYEYFYLIQCAALVIAGYYVLRKIEIKPWIAATGTLLFFMSPIVTYWYFEFINTNTFIAHMFIFLFIVKWLKTGKLRYVFLTGWSFFLGMFGTKLEFWFFEFVFFTLLLVLSVFVIKPKKASQMALMVWGSILIAVLAHAWQINLLINALASSGRMNVPHGIHNLFSLELYKNLFLSMKDTNLIPLVLICSFLIAGVHNKLRFRWLFIVTGIALVLVFKFWRFSFLPLFLHSPVLYGALAASILSFRIEKPKEMLSAWILFMLPAYYWCKPLVNFDEQYLLRAAPVLFQGVWGFLVWLGCSRIRRNRLLLLAYLSIIMVFVLQTQGQIVLSYLFGYLWIAGRDNYLIDFSFVLIAVFGASTHFRLKKILIKIIPFLIIFSSFHNPYYVAPLEPVPGYANPLMSKALSYNPFTGVPDLKEVIRGWEYLPSRRTLDPDIENKLPQNHGTFLLEGTGNAVFYGSMKPSRYSDLINFHNYGIMPEDGISGYPSTYSKKTISRLPGINTGKFTNNVVYYFTVWTIPPFELDLLRLLGVDHIVTRNDSLLTPLVKELKLKNIKRHGAFTTAELSDTLPRSFLVLNVNRDNIKDFNEGMHPRIALENDKEKLEENVYIARPAYFLSYKPEYVEVSVDSPCLAYLVLTDVFHPYWSAAVDGKDAEIIPAFHAFRAVKVPVGVHKVEFFCEVPYFKLSFLFSFILVLVSMVITFYFWDRKFNREHQTL